LTNDRAGRDSAAVFRFPRLDCLPLLLLTWSLVPGPVLGAAESRPIGRSAPGQRIALLGERHDLQRERDLQRLLTDLDARMAESEAAQNAWKAGRKSRRAGRKMEDLAPGELRLHFHPPEEVLFKRELHALAEIRSRIEMLASSPEDATVEPTLREIQELAAALENYRRPPVPRLNLFTVTALGLDFLDNSIGGGRRPAPNVPLNEDARQPADPPPSMFWTPGRPIATHNLHAGFGREELPDWPAVVWEYDQPKTSAGGNPGFEIRHGRTKAKLKFAETTSEPFTARIFHALGFHADVTDHVRQLRVRYDRRMLREFNLRREVILRFRLLGPPLYSLDLQREFDPLDSVETAVLKDGRRLDVAELRGNLYRDPARTAPHDDPANFNPDFEARIDHLVLAPANFQPDDDETRSVGRWDYAQLDHRHLRELRGAGLLAAWLGWFDCRFDNTSLRVRASADGGSELRAFFSDLGGGLGRTDRAFGWRMESPNDFPWEFTRPPVYRGPGRMTTPLRVVRFHTITDNAAFREMTDADARWMAGRIARLTREQLLGALIASGFDAAETRLYLAKLISRRDKLISDLGLVETHGLLGPETPGREFNFDPRTDEVPFVIINGREVRPRAGGQVIVAGELQPRVSGPTR
jgi:hypothetical protein